MWTVAYFERLHRQSPRPQITSESPCMSEWNGERAEILGVPISVITMADALSVIERWITRRTPHYVCITGVHGVIECRSDEGLRRVHCEAGLVTPDGMPLVWMAQALGYSHMRRVYGPDLMRELSAIGALRGHRVFLYGGGEGVAQRLAAALTQAHPGLQVVGVLTPPFRDLTPAEDSAIVAQINAAQPDIVWIGLSTPKQEKWMAEHLLRIDAPVMVGVGAAFDFLSGIKKQAPLWMQRNGLEWLFRLTTEPRRLWRRYSAIIPTFLVLASAQLACAWLKAGITGLRSVKWPTKKQRPL
jgi:N-acetylglucosaminyldiphosphoundecaprenol N-acetyl-beta-D-mannosaminyltransferase